MKRPALWTAFFLSGFAALVYQVLWVRQLSVVVGATTYALAAVLGTFMGGLALGSALAGRYADRAKSPLRTYAILEIGVSVWALLVPWLLSGVSAVYRSTPIDSPVAVKVGLAVALSCAVLLPATTFMGATLPVLSKHVARSRRTRGRDLGLLYAVNTFGAFAGVVFTGFWAIEALGIARSNELAVAASCSAAGLAFLLSRRPTVSADEDAESDPTREPTTFSTRAVLLMAGAAGFAGLAHEVVWNRLLGLVLLTTTYAYSTLLATVIAGIGIGSVVGARLADRVRNPERLFGILQMGIGVSALAILPLLTLLLREAPSVLESHTLAYRESQAIAIALCAASILLPSLLMGATYPPLARAITRSSDDVGRRVGQLYSVNTAAAVAGSLAGGFVLLPWLGALHSLAAISFLNLAVGLTVAWPRSPAEKRARAAVGGLALAAACLFGVGVTGTNLRDVYEARLPPGSQIVHLSEGSTSTVMVADHSEPEVRRIWVQSVWVAGSGGAHRMLGHLPALHAEHPRRAAGVAFGTGQSFAAALLHGLERIDCVDLDPGVVAAGSTFFAEHNGGLLARPEAHLYIEDGRSFLARADRTYDLIVMEPLQPWTAGAVNLYTREFYEDARRALAERGAIAQWLPLHDIPTWLARSIVGTFASVFERTHVYLDGYDLCLIGSSDALVPSLARFEERIRMRAVQEDMAAHDFGDALSVATALVLGPEDIARYVGDAAMLEDDRPFMEFVAPRVMSTNHFEANAAAIARACRTPLSAFADGATAPEGLTSCEVGRNILQGITALDQGQLAPSHAAYRRAFQAAPEVPRSRSLYRAATVRLAAVVEQMGRADQAVALYGYHLDEDPTFGGAWLNLGILLARNGEADAARRAFSRAAEDPTTADRARQAHELLDGARTHPRP